jgi:hypothetical protein
MFSYTTIHVICCMGLNRLILLVKKKNNEDSLRFAMRILYVLLLTPFANEVWREEWGLKVIPNKK